ncbi:MAG: RHS repeat domain-containing protein [Candidatus Methylacidiphilales bacterium]
MNFTYDALDRRIGKLVTLNSSPVTDATTWHYDGDHIWKEKLTTEDTESTEVHYLTGDRIDQILARHRSDDGLAFYLKDRMGSIRAIADDSGAVLSQTDYSSFGAIISQTNPDQADQFGFTGREFDEETGLYYYRARVYDANLGRFISQDPIGFGAEDVSLSAYSLRGPPEWGAQRLLGSPDIHAYRYVFNQPQGMVDHFGLAGTVDYGLHNRGKASVLANQRKLELQRLARNEAKLNKDLCDNFQGAAAAGLLAAVVIFGDFPIDRFQYQIDAEKPPKSIQICRKKPFVK